MEKQTINDLIYDINVKYHSLTNKKEIDLSIYDERLNEYIVQDLPIEKINYLSNFIANHLIESYEETAIKDDYIHLDININLIN